MTADTPLRCRRRRGPQATRPPPAAQARSGPAAQPRRGRSGRQSGDASRPDPARGAGPPGWGESLRCRRQSHRSPPSAEQTPYRSAARRILAPTYASAHCVAAPLGAIGVMRKPNFKRAAARLRRGRMTSVAAPCPIKSTMCRSPGLLGGGSAGPVKRPAKPGEATPPSGGSGDFDVSPLTSNARRREPAGGRE